MSGGRGDTTGIAPWGTGEVQYPENTQNNQGQGFSDRAGEFRQQKREQYGSVDNLKEQLAGKGGGQATPFNPTFSPPPFTPPRQSISPPQQPMRNWWQ